MDLLIQILLYTVRFSGFFIYLYGAYQFIEIELSKTYDKRKDKQLEINKRRTKYFWIMILGIFLIFVTGIFQ